MLTILLSALLTLFAICALVGLVAMAVGGLLVWVADRELRQQRRSKEPRK